MKYHFSYRADLFIPFFVVSGSGFFVSHCKRVQLLWNLSCFTDCNKPRDFCAIAREISLGEI